MSARRLGLTVALATMTLLISAGSAAANKPVRACSDDFELMGILEFRALMNAPAFHATLPAAGQALAPDLLAVVNSNAWLEISAKIDANGDGQLCLKQKTLTSGHLWGWSWNAVDNTKNS